MWIYIPRGRIRSGGMDKSATEACLLAGDPQGWRRHKDCDDEGAHQPDAVPGACITCGYSVGL